MQIKTDRISQVITNPKILSSQKVEIIQCWFEIEKDGLERFRQLNLSEAGGTFYFLCSINVLFDSDYVRQ